MDNHPADQAATKALNTKNAWWAWLVRPTIGKKIGSIFVLALGLLLAMDMGYHAWQQDTGQVAQTVNEAGNLRWISQRIALTAILEADNPQQLRKTCTDLIERFDQGLHRLGQIHLSLGQEELRQQMGASLRTLAAAWATYRTAAVELQNNSNDPARRQTNIREITTNAGHLLAATEELVKATIKANIGKNLHMHKMREALEAGILGLLLIAFLYVHFRLVKPLRQVMHATRAFASGDYTSRVKYAANDEIGEMVSIVNSSADNIESLINKLEQQRQLASDNEARLGSILRSAGEGIVITERIAGHNHIAYVNPAFEHITGYKAKEVLGRSPAFLHKDDHDQPGLSAIRHALEMQQEGRAMLRNYRKDGRLFWNELSLSPISSATGEITQYVGIINDVTEQKRYEEQLEKQANHDALTGLPNRNLLKDRLDQAIQHASRTQRHVGILFIGLDNFKLINNSLGHSAGDLAMIRVAERLEANLRPGDTVARYSGDEFVLVLADLSATEDAKTIAEKLTLQFSHPFELAGQTLTITASTGISTYPDCGADRSTLLMNADSAMRNAKVLGKNNYLSYAPDMRKQATARLSLENDLRHALERQELELYYQPQVDLKTGRITGVEALLRWHHPERGMVSPAEFIPVAEETGLIESIGEWVLDTACQQAKAWQGTGPNSVHVAVNLSARQFHHRGLWQIVHDCLARHNLHGRYLELEITESLVMQNAEAAAELLKDLKGLGLTIAVDDFGTGYSSLGYLQLFPFDKIKIDQMFTRAIGNDAQVVPVVPAIIALAKNLHLKIIAEGVETDRQLAYLSEQGCDEIQGYLFSRPLPAEELTAMLASDQRLASAAPTAPPRLTDPSDDHHQA